MSKKVRITYVMQAVVFGNHTTDEAIDKVIGDFDSMAPSDRRRRIKEINVKRYMEKGEERDLNIEEFREEEMKEK